VKAREKAASLGLGVLLALQGGGTFAEARQVTVDAKVLEQLQQLVQEQQKQLDRLQKQVDAFQQTAVAAQAQAQEAKTVAEEVKTSTQAAKTVISGSERVRLAISGQVDRAINVADDGKETDVYFVDNNSSTSRVRFVGTAGLNEDMTLGSKIEVSLAPNLSTKVNQKNQSDSSDNDLVDERVAEVYLQSRQYGTLTLGKGSTASDYTAEVDLSGTDVVLYSDYTNIAGGLLFRESASGELTDIKLSDAFKNFDGLSRQSRLRYDTPMFYGFSLAGSVISDSRWDAVLRWNGSGYGFKMAAAAAVDYINTDNADYQYDGSFSVLHTDTGLNFTFSAGTQDAATGDSPYGLYGKLGWQSQFCPLGTTSFGVDYGHTENLPVGEDGDEGDTFGLAVVQSFADYGTEVFLQFRQYSLDRAARYDKVDDINVGTIGARVKF